MKTIFLVGFILLNTHSKAGLLYALADTIDFWHVFYNGKLIKQYIGYNAGDTLKIKSDHINTADSITVKYFRDTPCDECKAYLLIENSVGTKAYVAQGSQTFVPLTLSLKDIRESNDQQFSVYYLEDTNHHKVKLFEIKLE